VGVRVKRQKPTMIGGVFVGVWHISGGGWMLGCSDVGMLGIVVCG